jgi:hypothetical protein
MVKDRLGEFQRMAISHHGIENENMEPEVFKPPKKRRPINRRRSGSIKTFMSFKSFSNGKFFDSINSAGEDIILVRES